MVQIRDCRGIENREATKSLLNTWIATELLRVKVETKYPIKERYMKRHLSNNHKFFLIVVMFGVLLVMTAFRFAEADSWELTAAIPSAKKVPQQGPNYFTIVTDNSRLSGEVHFSEGGRDLRFRLFREGTLLWEKPAPSDWIMIPAEKDLVVMVGLSFGEGMIHEGKVVFEHLYAYDAHGNQIANIQDTGPIGRLHLLRDGRLIYLSGEVIKLIDFNLGGQVMWSVTKSADDLKVFDGGHYFSIQKWHPGDETRETALLETKSGKLLKSIRDRIEADPMFFSISSDQKYAFVRRTRGTKPLICDILVYEIGHWDVPVFSFESLGGGPFAANRSADNSTIAYALLSPLSLNNPDSIQVLLEIRNSHGRKVFERNFDPGPFDWDRSYLRFDPGDASLRLLYHATEFQFTRPR